MSIPDWRAMTDTDLEACVQAGQDEIARRAREQVVTDTLDEVVTAARTDTPGDPWQPYDGTMGSLYPAWWVVARDGHRWESLIPHNATTPGDTGDPQNWRWWRDLGPIDADPDPDPDPGAPPPWTVGVTYMVGDTVTHDGHTYTCRQAHTSQPGWEPPAVPALWTQED